MDEKTRKFFASRALAAAALLLGLNLWFAKANPLATVRTVNLQRCEIFTAKQELLKENIPPDLVLLGSSLMVAPLMQAEAEYLGAPFPRHAHRRLQVVEHLLSSRLPTAPTVLSMAVAGSMVSDAYFIAKNLLVRKHAPLAIVYGIAPRDLQDNTLPGIESTETFRIVSDLQDVPAVLADQHQSTLDPAVDLTLSRISPVWNYRNDLKVYYLWRLKKASEKVMPWIVFDKYDETMVVKPRRNGVFPEEAVGTLMAFPGRALDHHDEQSTRQEYLKRYNPPNPVLINDEFNYLSKLIRLCRQRDIPLVIVNMPLSRTNVDLMQAGFYTAYLDRLKHICVRSSVPLVDFCKSPYTDPNLFVDGVHLAPSVSHKFLRDLCDCIADSPIPHRLATARGAQRLTTSEVGKNSL